MKLLLALSIGNGSSSPISLRISYSTSPTRF